MVKYLLEKNNVMTIIRQVAMDALTLAKRRQILHVLILLVYAKIAEME